MATRESGNMSEGGGYSLNISGNSNAVAQGEGARQYNLRDRAQHFEINGDFTNVNIQNYHA
ncbi:hypothetical protein TWF718_002912 [Orbilia javanica]|uniref:Uncharacterized protein n=1 Tax=Orbilia javanica TaxID=47235 RepID=A0AAN8MP28_9PEZI